MSTSFAKNSVHWVLGLVLCLSAGSAFVSPAQTIYPFTSRQQRDSTEQRLRDTVIAQAFRNPLSNATEGQWMQAFWPMKLMQYTTPETDRKVAEAWSKFEGTSPAFQKALLELSYGLYSKKFGPQALAALKKTEDGTIFIRLAEYLLQANRTAYRPQILQQLNQRFLTTAFIGFDILRKRLNPAPAQALPLLKKLLDTGFLPGKTIIFTLHRANRNYEGLVLIRKPDGQWLRNPDGSIFQTTQLARSLSGYPFYLTNGNTPQGLFRWTGVDTSQKRCIGPTTNLQLVMPNEVPYHIFMGDTLLENRAITYDDYRQLLPAAWSNYDGIYESLYAGTIGRNEIIMHGTTINPDYYKGKTYWPQTPSMGCLCSYEEWDANGLRIKSNQEKIAEALRTNGLADGYVLVLNLDDAQAPVRWQDVEQKINTKTGRKKVGTSLKKR